MTPKIAMLFLLLLQAIRPVGRMNLVLLLSGNRKHVDVRVTGAVLELNGAVNQRIQRVVAAHAHVQTRAMDGTTLAADDVTGLCKLTSKNLHAETFALALAAVLRTTYTFFMCHNRYNF